MISLSYEREKMPLYFLDNQDKLKQQRNISIAIEPSPAIPHLTVITLKGSLDLSTSSYVDEKIIPLLETGESDFILDVSELDYLSSIGMMCLTKYLILLQKQKRSLKLIKPPKSIYDIMTYFGFAKRFSIYDSVVDAIRSN